MVQKNSLKYDSIIILGPTACGKTALSVALAQKLHTEIISADSMQIYRGLDIGSAKVTMDEMQGIKHHMIDIVDADANYSVVEYKAAVESIASDIIKSGKTPIIVGGTGFYLTALTQNNDYGCASSNAIIREKYNKILEEQGKECLYSKLQKVDPESATKLHINDTKRIIRALEIYEITGKTKSQLERENKENINDSLLHPLIIGLNLSTRQKLYDKIDARVDVMFDMGLEAEVRDLIEGKNLTKDNQSMQGIGYKEFFDYFDNTINIDELKQRICLNTRHYAKRQLTYFNKFDVAKWYYTDIESSEDIVNDICTLLGKK